MPGNASVAFYSLSDEAYRARVHACGRMDDQNFAPDERLYRRIREEDLVNGELPSTALQFNELSGHSLNRGAYSQPQDVLEPDCCSGQKRDGCAVLQLAVHEVPTQIQGQDDTIFKFRMKHVPYAECYAHSEIWCNRTGEISEPYEMPARLIKNLFRGELGRVLLRRHPLRFDPL